jgi:hypothetical protein
VRRDWVLADTRRTDTALVSRTEAAITVTNEMTLLVVLKEGFSHLPGDPLGRLIADHRDPDEPSSRLSKNHQPVKQLE